MRSLLTILTLLCISPLSFGGLVEVKDSTGQTLKQVRESYFNTLITRKGDRAYFTTVNHKGKTTGQYEMHGATSKTIPTLFLSEADKLNRIDFKSSSYLKSKSYREKRPGKHSWSEWKNGSPVGAVWLSVKIMRKNGKFVVTPVSGSQYIRKAPRQRTNTPRTLRDLTKQRAH